MTIRIQSGYTGSDGFTEFWQYGENSEIVAHAFAGGVPTVETTMNYIVNKHQPIAYIIMDSEDNVVFAWDRVRGHYV